MNRHFMALGLACTVGLGAVCTPAASQGLRVPAQPGAGRPAAPSGPAATLAPQSADFIVAVVNSEPITNNEVRGRAMRYVQQLQAAGSPVPPAAQLAREVLERLISEKAQLQLAREQGIKVEEALVDQAEQNVARQNQVDVAELRRRMVADGMVPSQFRDDLRNQLLLTRLRERELEPRARVSELDIDQFLREQQAGGASAATELNLAHILVAVPDNSSEAQVNALQAKARQLQERARAGEDFARLAREHSNAAGAAASGGVIGLRSADRLPPLFVEAVRNLNEGGVSEVLRSAAGFHIVKVVEKRQAQAGAMAVTQTRVRHILLRPGAQLTEAAARQRLADFKRRIEAKQADFAQLAKEFSQDASGPNGGELGWANPGTFVPEFEDTMNSLAPGQLADPIVSRFGVHLVQVVERRQVALSQREQREAARAMVRERKLDEAYASWAQEVRGRAYVEFREPPQ
jgi:peptidyl-prolyl cis-trans isomerase SurA